MALNPVIKDDVEFTVFSTTKQLEYFISVQYHIMRGHNIRSGNGVMSMIMRPWFERHVFLNRLEFVRDRRIVSL